MNRLVAASNPAGGQLLVRGLPADHLGLVRLRRNQDNNWGSDALLCMNCGITTS